MWKRLKADDAARRTQRQKAELCEIDSREQRAKQDHSSIPCHRAGLPEGPGTRAARLWAQGEEQETSDG